MELYAFNIFNLQTYDIITTGEHPAVLKDGIFYIQHIIEI